MDYLFYDLPLYVWGILVVFFVALTVQLYYYLFIYRKVASFKIGEDSKPVDDDLKPMSVVIYVRNEADNLKKYLPAILEQDYPTFEVIVVNDCSSDDTEDILKTFQKSYPILQIRNLVPATVSLNGKAVPLGVGIKAAQYDHLVLTEANCCPDSNRWLASLSAAFDKNHQVVMAYTRSGGPGFSRADRFFNALSELGHAIKGTAYTNPGENVAFHKSLFFDNKGFNSFLHKSTKVEKIFFNLVAQDGNTNVVLKPESINCSSLSLSFSEWRRDKRQILYSEKWFRQGTRYNKLPEIFSRLFLFVSLPFAIYFSLEVMWAWISVASAFAIRWIIQICIFYQAQKKLSEKKLLLSSICWDWCAIFAYVTVLFSSRAKR